MKKNRPTQQPTAVATPPAPATASWPALLLITLLAIPAIRPLLSEAISCGFDTVFHLWRAVQLGLLWQDGVWFSRWAPDMAQGYGYPLYLYQSPLSAAFVALLEKIGLSWPAALNATYAIATIASGWSMWLLARPLWGERGAVLTAVAYLYAPFHAYILFYRASLSEAVAWAILPLLLWGLLRWQQTSSRRGLATAVASWLLLVVSHDVTVYAAMPLLLGWIAAIAWHGRSWPQLGRGLAAVGLGLGSSAFFWLPTFVERSAIQFERANSAWPFWYFNNFLPLDQLLAGPRNADPTFLNDWPERGLGWFLLLMALTGAAVAWKQRPWQQKLTLFLLAALIGYLSLTVAASRPLWQTVSLLQTFQFPWRFLAPATLIAALLVGGLAAQPFRLGRWPSLVAPLTAVALLILLHLGWFYPAQCAAPSDISRQGMLAWEAASDTIGSTASRELLPVTVQQMPSQAAEFPLALRHLPADAILHQADYGPLRATLDIETAVPFTAELSSFYFAGWRAWVDGQAVDVQPSTPEGLISVPIPDGRHTLTVAFGETPSRWAADGLSLLSLAVVGLLLWRLPGRPQSATAVGHDTAWWLGLTVVGLVVLGGQWGLIDRQLTPLRHSRLQNGQLSQLEHHSQLTFGQAANPAQIRLLGYEAWPTAVAADQPLPLSLYWQALQPLDQPYRVGLALIDEDGVRWTAEGLRANRWTREAPPTQQWQPGQYTQTAVLLDIRQGTPPGEYGLYLSLFHQETLAPLTIYEAGQALGPQIRLGTVTVLPPQQATDSSAWQPIYRSSQLTLFQAQLDRAEAAPGETMMLTLQWQLATQQGQQLTVHLQDSHGRGQHRWALDLPAYGRGVWLSQQLLTLPASLATDRYQWQLEMADGTVFEGGSLQINAPARQFSPPEMTAIEPVMLFAGEQAVVAVVGFELDTAVCQAGMACPLRLVWQVAAETSQSFRVFVHLLDETGQLVAQSDGVMAGWTRPSTGWLTGEYIADDHTLALNEVAAGTYRLVVGVYGDDGRLQTGDSSDHVEVTTLHID